MEIIGPILISFIAGLSTVIGSLVIFAKTKRVEEFIVFSLSFSMVIMICISIFELIPESSLIILSKYGILKGAIICIAVFSLGGIGVELINKKIKESSDSSLYKIGILSMISLLLHNIPEGIAVFMSAYTDINLGISLGIAIMMHNIPEGISIAVPLYYSTKKKGKAILYTFISGLAEPAGAIMTYILLRNYISNVILSIVLIFVAGIMITLAITKIFKEASNYNKPKYMRLGALVGYVLFILLNFFH